MHAFQISCITFALPKRSAELVDTLQFFTSHKIRYINININYKYKYKMAKEKEVRIHKKPKSAMRHKTSGIYSKMNHGTSGTCGFKRRPPNVYGIYGRAAPTALNM